MTSIARAMLEGSFDWEKLETKGQIEKLTTKKRKSLAKKRNKEY